VGLHYHVEYSAQLVGPFCEYFHTKIIYILGNENQFILLYQYEIEFCNPVFEKYGSYNPKGRTKMTTSITLMAMA